jgi:hypothetical protein
MNSEIALQFCTKLEKLLEENEKLKKVQAEAYKTRISATVRGARELELWLSLADMYSQGHKEISSQPFEMWESFTSLSTCILKNIQSDENEVDASIHKSLVAALEKSELVLNEIDKEIREKMQTKEYYGNWNGWKNTKDWPDTGHSSSSIQSNNYNSQQQNNCSCIPYERLQHLVDYTDNRVNRNTAMPGAYFVRGAIGY